MLDFFVVVLLFGFVVFQFCESGMEFPKKDPLYSSMKLTTVFRGDIHIKNITLKLSQS